MIEEPAVVSRVHGNKIWIKSRQGSACGACAQQQSCSTAVLKKLAPNREFMLESHLALNPGDQVMVGIDNAHLLLGSVLLYLIPLIFSLAGVGLLNAFLPPTLVEEWLPEIFLVLLLTMFFLIHQFQNYLLLRVCCQPRIVGKLLDLGKND